ncbi:hypothetical protein ACLM5J_11135 [Nocardioides sp. Bht2]|uniref:hypothetical protein n=1 Tax=Nocardioides sp. Bht2 TaxID=3392297 RepID=UPI0039B520B8
MNLSAALAATPVRIGLAALLAPIGAATAIASVAVHDANWAWFVLGLAAPAATTLALPAGWLRFGFVLGWVAMILVVIQGTAAGSWAISADLRGYLFLTGGLGLMVTAVVTAPVPGRRAPAPSATPSADA